MIDKLSSSITENLSKNNSLCLDDEEKLYYAIYSILSEGIKIILLLIFFNLIGRLDFFLFSFAILSSTRVFAGGFHTESFIKCLLSSTLFFICTCIIALLVPDYSIEVYYLILTASLILNIIYAPKPSKNRPIISIRRRNLLKIFSVASTIIWTLILVLSLKNSDFFKCGVATLFTQSIQLIKFERRRSI